MLTGRQVGLSCSAIGTVSGLALSWAGFLSGWKTGALPPSQLTVEVVITALSVALLTLIGVALRGGRHGKVG